MPMTDAGRGIIEEWENEGGPDPTMVAAIEEVERQARLVPPADALAMGERDCMKVLAWWQAQAWESAARAERAEAVLTRAPSEGLRAALGRILKIARAAQNTYVGRHWPDQQAMRHDGIGFGLNDGKHEDRIRRFLYECQPEFLVQYLEQARAALAEPTGGSE